jgi:hypothetical protein
MHIDRYDKRLRSFFGILVTMVIVCGVVLASAAATAQTQNLPPKISGSPPVTATVGQFYGFTPIVDDDRLSKLSFVIKRRPKWLSFSYSTGKIAGTPGTAEAGKLYTDIQICVDDGPNLAVCTKKFAIKVESPVVANIPPAFTSEPPVNATVGVRYDYLPTIKNDDNDVLTFAIENRPPWASFDTATGRMTGTPSAEHVGVRSAIRISVSDGNGGTALQSFGTFTTHPAIVSSKVTLSWTPPTQNTDGTPLTNLAGYRIVYGPSAASLNEWTAPTIDVPNAGISTYVLENLTAGTWYFAVRSYTLAGLHSVNSNVASKTL